jgi:ABC-type phosphate transport system auxiliary subunit
MQTELTKIESEVNDLKNSIEVMKTDLAIKESRLERLRIFEDVEKLMASLSHKYAFMFAADKQRFVDGEYHIGTDLLLMRSNQFVFYFLSWDQYDKNFKLYEVYSGNSPYVTSGTIEQLIEFFK